MIQFPVPKKINFKNLSKNLENIEGLYQSNTFIKIYQKVEKIYIGQFLSNTLNNKEYRFGIANLDIVEFISTHTYRSYIYSSEINEINDYKKEIMNNFVNTKYNKMIIPINKGFKKKIKSKIKFILDNLKYLLFYKNLKKVFHIGSIQLESKHFCNENKLYPIKLDIFNMNLNFKQKNIENIENKIDLMLKSLKQEFEYLNNNEILDIKKELNEILLSSFIFFQSSFNFIKKLKYDSFFLATIGGYLPIRNFLSACIVLDYKVYGFCHGFTSITNQLPVFSWDSSLVVSNIVLPSKKYEEKYNYFFDKIKYKIKFPKINFYKSSPYIEIYNSIIRKKIKKIKNIIIISYPKTFLFNLGEFYSHIYSSSILEDKLIKTLHKKSIEVIIKSHPDRVLEQKIITGDKCRIIDGKFEKIYHYYDCAIFIYHRSTAFCFAIMTDMPIILIKNELIDLDDNTYKVLSKRCAIVNATNQKNDEIHFDEKELNVALQDAILKSSNKDWKIFL